SDLVAVFHFDFPGLDQIVNQFVNGLPTVGGLHFRNDLCRTEDVTQIHTSLVAAVAFRLKSTGFSRPNSDCFPRAHPIQSNRPRPYKTSPVYSRHHFSAVSKPTRAVTSGTPSNNTITFPSQMITAEKKRPCCVMSDWRVLNVWQVSVT